MSNLADSAMGRPRHYGAQKGIVTNVTDPLGKHRVKAQVPGKCDETAWLWPLTAGGGSAQRGGHAAPIVGADIVLLWHDGDPNGDGWYACGSWGAVDGTSESPIDLDVDIANAALIQTWQFGPLAITLDERPGKRKFILRDTETDDHILWDLDKKALEVVMSTAVKLAPVGALLLEGLQVALNKRHVLPNGKTI